MNQTFRRPWPTLGVMATRERSDEWMHYVRLIGDNFHRIRTSKGLGQEKVAYEAGLSRATIQRVENPSESVQASTNPTLGTLVSLCRVLEVDLVDVLPDGPLPDPTPVGTSPRPFFGGGTHVPDAKTLPRRR